MHAACPWFQTPKGDCGTRPTDMPSRSSSTLTDDCRTAMIATWNEYTPALEQVKTWYRLLKWLHVFSMTLLNFRVKLALCDVYLLAQHKMLDVAHTDLIVRTCVCVCVLTMPSVFLDSWLKSAIQLSYGWLSSQHVLCWRRHNGALESHQHIWRLYHTFCNLYFCKLVHIHPPQMDFSRVAPGVAESVSACGAPVLGGRPRQPR